MTIPERERITAEPISEREPAPVPQPIKSGGGAGNALWGLLLIAAGAVFLLARTVSISIDAGYYVSMGFGGASLVFVAVWGGHRERWWALIPAWAMFAVGGLIGLAVTGVSGTLIATYILSAVGFPFMVVYILDTRNWWALIPAYVMFAVAGMILLIGMGILRNFLVPAYITGAFVPPFLTVYLANRNNWWALIPAGVMGVAAASFLVASAFNLISYVIPALLILGGLALLFGNRLRPSAQRIDR